MTSIIVNSRATARDWLALVVLMFPVLLVSVDNTALAFALPSITRDLGPDAAQQLWIIDAYPLVLAGLLVAMGNLGDRFGRRRLLVIGATGFAAVSALASLSTSAEQLIAARAAMGLFGASLMPSTLSLLRSTFTDRAQRRLAIAIWATMFSAGSALGPIVGGVLVEHGSWHWVFLIAVPVLLPLLIGAPLLVRESRDSNPGPVDVPGIVYSIAMLGSSAFAMKHLATKGFDPAFAAAVVAAVIATWLFVRRMRTQEHPMLDIALLKLPAFFGGVMMNLLSVIALVGYLFFITQHLQLVLGMTALEASLMLIPGAAAMIVAGLAAVWIVKRLPAGLTIMGGIAFSMAAYLALAAFGSQLGITEVIVTFVLLGIGVGAAETLSNDLIIAAAPADKAGAAAGVSETAYEMGAVLGTALLGGMLAAVYRGGVELPSALSSQDAHLAGETLGGAVEVADRLATSAPETAAALLSSAQQAFDSGVAVAAYAGVALMLGAMLIAVLTLRKVR